VKAAEFELVGSVANGTDPISTAAMLAPDVVVLDITMTGMDGIECARQSRRADCSSKLAFLSADEDVDYVRAAFDAGGMAHVVTTQPARHLVATMREALAGRRFVSTAGS
jgi:DNA-binding NarL/FixJ family response regulator